MKYFIFGGNGFVGRYLANALLERNEKVLYVTYTQPLMNELQRVASIDRLIFVISNNCLLYPFLRMTLLSILLLINTIPRCPVIEETTSLA